MTAKKRAILDTDNRQLASLLELDADDDAGRLWQDNELSALLRHQMTAPLHVDLIHLERGLALKVRNLAEAEGLTLKSFGDLLAHPNPPLELLKATKDFAKACRLSPRSPIPHEIASVLYFSSIAAALVHRRRRITGLSDTAVSEGLSWVAGRPWIDTATRSLAESALSLLNPAHGGRL